MYQIRLIMTIWDGSSVDESKKWISVSKELVIPFVPFVGLKVGLPLERSWSITSITWDVEEEIFRCTLMDIFDELSFDSPTFEEWKERFDENNWKTVGPYPTEN